MKPLILTLFSLLILLACGGSDTTPAAPAQDAVPSLIRVDYSVRAGSCSMPICAGPVRLTLSNKTGDTEQHDKVSIPYKKTIYVPDGQALYISAQNQRKQDDSAVICEIKIGGEVLKRAESTGRYAIATCSGTARR